MNNLLKRYIKLVLEGDKLARVPQQLVSSDGENSGKVDDKEEEKMSHDGVQEFSGAGAVAGYVLPLGMKTTTVKNKRK
jgi:hypothetical protein